MNKPFPTTLTADAVKEKAKALGADLVGIADGGVMAGWPKTMVETLTRR